MKNDGNTIHIALVMMMKNEQKRLHVTLNSVVNVVKSLIIYDTGSTDESLNILNAFSTKHNIPLRLIEGTFVDFSTSRNRLLEFADTFLDVDYYLLMDVNDELRGGSNLIKYAKHFLDSNMVGFLVCQEWWSGVNDVYYNVRLIKARKEWRYERRVHEFLNNKKYRTDDNDFPSIFKFENDVVLYQDRTQDDDKTGKRFKRDKILLYEDYRENPTDTRTPFYLAQTCSCLDEIEDSFYFYKIRSNLGGFIEEKFHSYLRCGEISEVLKHPWHESMAWYMKAYELINRVEPILKIVEHYHKLNNMLLAFTFINLACLLNFPMNCILFVDKLAYDYKRWHLLGVIGFDAGFIKEGKIGCDLALAFKKNSKIRIPHNIDEEYKQRYDKISNKNK
jgi:glycosyltransferase involved in cell wall biosynthesis